MDRAGRPRTGRTARPTRMGLAVEASRTHLTEDRKARAIRSSPGTWARRAHRGPGRGGYGTGAATYREAAPRPIARRRTLELPGRGSTGAVASTPRWARA